ncbi:MFS transporter [Heliorestis convoluta]|uniref:Major facilitator superfamily MFS_1 n=1 Tax=Heliorestis convoluta TaxID=356322 RepID=A0A5Q2MWS9_9FIRM|nr:MFS transporter [Heliorestis convoluta]QGG47024.1 Major facilitator superfamily MFS_1 [Heliorestis convoluta]
MDQSKKALEDSAEAGKKEWAGTVKTPAPAETTGSEYAGTEFASEWAGSLKEPFPAGPFSSTAGSDDGSKGSASGESTVATSPSNWVLLALAGVPLIMVLGNSMLIPAFPQIREAMGITPLQVGLLITFFSIPAGLAIPFVGFLSDRMERKKIIVPALLIYGLGGLISGLSPVLFGNSYTVMLAGRIIQGLGAAGTAPLAMALVGDLYQSKARNKALGVLEATNGMGKVISPILGSLLVLFIWWSIFYVYAALAIPVALAVAFLVKESKKEKAAQGKSLSAYFSGVFSLFKKKASTLLVAFFGGMLALFTLFGVLAYLSDALEATYGLQGVQKGLVLALPVLASASTALGTGFLLQKKPNFLKTAILIGLALFSISLVLSALFQTIPAVLALLAVLGLGVGLLLPGLNTIVTSSAPEEERGAMTAFYGGVRFIGVALGPPVFSLLERGGPVMLYAPWAVVGAITLFLAWRYLQPPKSQATGSA